MALPKLLQKLFTNGGAGDKLNPDIIPVDSALSSTSENPVQNKVINSALDGKLSTSGGTMTGDIQFTNGDIWFNRQSLGIRGRTNDTYLEICPGPTSAFAAKTGASLMMTGRDYTGTSIPKGCFYLTAANEANGNKTLSGSPDGSLTWDGHNVITVVSESYAWGNGYRKYSDGWIEQVGTNYFPENENTLGITLPIAFSDGDYAITFCTNGSPRTYPAWLSFKNATNFTVSRSDNAAGMGVWWCACGK